MAKKTTLGPGATPGRRYTFSAKTEAGEVIYNITVNLAMRNPQVTFTARCPAMGFAARRPGVSITAR